MKRIILSLAALAVSLLANAQEYKTVTDIPYRVVINDAYSAECCKLDIQYKEGAKDLPVVVFFHGGGMTSGSANGDGTSGANLAKAEDVVVVTVNHRLGVLGYLDLSAYGEQYALSGNVGVLDMAASLQWIHENIAAFGGDPDNVTVFGQSGGGAKVLALMTTPYARGLLHKGINESGATDTLGPVFAAKEINGRVAELTLEALQITP